MNSVASVKGEDWRQFLVFARKMLQWLPDDRKSAKELFNDPWLKKYDTPSTTNEIRTNRFFCVIRKIRNNQIKICNKGVSGSIRDT